MGNKGPDYHAAFGCYACHEALDQHRLSKEGELFYWLRGIERTHGIWIESGLLFLPASAERVAHSSKIMPRRHLATGEVL
jgi:hypothetical protein